MQVRASKTGATVSSLVEPNHVELTADSEKVGYQEDPRFLGLYLNRQLDMQDHLDIVCGRARKRMAAVRKLCAASWTPKTIQVYTFYRALDDSVIFFAAGCWMPLLKAQ